LRSLAAQEPSANGRNYYLTQALEAEQRLVIDAPDPSRLPDDLLAGLPVGSFLRAMTARLDAEKADGKRLTVAFRFPDIGEEWGMQVRNSVVEVQPRLPEDADMTVTCDSQVWKEILTRKRNATAAFATGAVQVDRNRLELVRFLLLFR
jgi:alkyl sulfatase BDS1-like metallo-beta-lactamase superfamily hydrolase